MGIGDDYQQQTKYDRDSIAGGLRWDDREGPYKFYENPLDRIELPAPDTGSGACLWDVLARRRSVRRFSGREMSLAHLSQLLWSANGITARTRGAEFRTSPSAGALYPVETYLAANRVEDLEPGIYHHDVFNRRLDFLREGYFGRDVAQAALGQMMCDRAAVSFIWTCIPARSKWKYRERAYRYIYLDAGHLGENLHLAACAIGHGCCMIGAFFDSELNELLDVDGQSETAIYLAAAGPVD